MADHIAAALRQRQVDTTVVTSFPSKMKGVIFPGFRRKLAEVTRPAAGFTLCRVFTIF